MNSLLKLISALILLSFWANPAVLAKEDIREKAKVHWVLLASTSMNDESLANLFRFGTANHLPIYFRGVPTPSTSEAYLSSGVRELQHRVAKIVADFGLQKVPLVFLNPKPFRTASRLSVPALLRIVAVPKHLLTLANSQTNVLKYQVDAGTPSQEADNAVLVSIFEQYGNVSIQEAKTLLSDHSESHLIDLVVDSLTSGKIHEYHQLKDKIIRIQGSTFSVSEPDPVEIIKQRIQQAPTVHIDSERVLLTNLERIHRLKSERTEQSTLPLVSETRLETPTLPIPREVNIAGTILARPGEDGKLLATAFPQQVLFLDLENKLLREVLEKASDSEVRKFVNGSRVILTGLSCRTEKSQQCWHYWEKKLGSELYLNTDALDSKIQPNALTLVRQALSTDIGEQNPTPLIGTLVVQSFSELELKKLFGFIQ